MPEGSQLCQEAKTRLETDQWSTSGKEVEHQWPMPQTNIHPSKHKHTIMSKKTNGNNNLVTAVVGKSNTMLNAGLGLIENSQNRAALTFCLALL